MLITKSGIGIFFGHRKLYRLLRTGMGASRAGLAVAGDMYCLSVNYTDRSGWTNPLADSAAGALIRYI